MTIQQLEYLIALDTHRHFVKAAEFCHVTQPTLTMQLKKLEDEVGALLFDRKKHPIEPTSAGELMISKARMVLREINDMKHLMSREIESIEGEYRLGVIPTIAPYIIPEFLARFSKNHPETRLIVEEMKTSSIISALKRDEIDMGILVTPLGDSEIREEVLYYEPFLAYAAIDHKLHTHKKLTTDKLSTEGLFLLSEGHCFRDQMINLCNKKESNSDHFHYESGSIETIKNMVKKIGGYSLVPETSILSNPKDEHLIRFSSPEPAREVSIAVHNTFSREALIENIRKDILECVPDKFEKNDRFFRVKWR